MTNPTTGRSIPFLHALDLDDEADERAVRRAYAQRLRRIDPELDPDAFQVLRGHYENALRWAQRRREAVDEGAGDEVALVADAAEAPETPQAPVTASAVVDEDARMRALGDEVFGGFAQLAAAGFTDEAACRRALSAALDDERLINLEARTFFEWRVACLLMEGWRPGHEFLFGPACQVFNWGDDRRRLSLFGQLGEALDAAITEKLIFFGQPPHEFDVQRDLIRRLREAKQPPSATLVEQAPRLRMLVQRYPHWLRIVTSRENIAQWQAWRDELPPGAVAAPTPQAERPVPNRDKEPSSGLSWWPFAILIFLAVRALSFLGQSAEVKAFHPWTPSTSSTQWRAPGAPQPSLILPESQIAPALPASPDTWPPKAVPAASAPKSRAREVPKPSPYSLSSGSKAVEDAVPDSAWSQRSKYEPVPEVDPPVAPIQRSR
ncbi:hypothetical protein [Rhizobacter sp. OV335]|uniref:hypothetical protein n=1 Tax=Rhizobacter sp. OV335 TaxID=1500264 RepID=UPI000916DC6A|nr:hypothetical protein [Rhizobacter sp. OV335]SHN33576.1 protein TonB [Rhizobacter sp. OV335]